MLYQVDIVLIVFFKVRKGGNLSRTFVTLVGLYEANGFTVQSSLSPAHFPGFSLAEIPFTYIYQGDVRMSNGGGIALSEITFLESLFTARSPKNIFVIGNAFGWSTLALGIMCPNARVVAIDWCPRTDEERGLEVTNELAAVLGTDIVAVKGKSPEDVQGIVGKYFQEPIDFVLIDGNHSPNQLRLDFEASKSVAAPNCIYVFHDVISFGMVEAFVGIAADNPHLTSSLLFRTPSGMAISYPSELESSLGPVVNAFTETDERVRALHKEGRERLNN